MLVSKKVLNVTYDVLYTDHTVLRSWLETHPSMKVATARLEELRSGDRKVSMDTVQMNHAGYSDQIAP